MKNASPIEEYLIPGKRAHLVGIGGVSMCPLAEVLQGMGLQVQGSDMTESLTVQRLRELGIPVEIGHNAENLKRCDFVIRTAAVGDGNPEIAGAIARGIPVYERAEGWGAIMRRYDNALCVSGTHGKTTTTSMCTHIFMAAEKDPTVMIGGTLPLLHAGYRVGQGDVIILESCEYRDSFLKFFPTVAVILNVEADHLDYFRDLNQIQRSFRQFAELVPEKTGRVIINADNPSAMEAMRELDRPVFMFSLNGDKNGENIKENRRIDCVSKNLIYHHGAPEFDIIIHGELYAHVKLQVYGEHNVMNALAAASAAYVLGVPGEAVEKGLAGFNGAGRRFQKKGVFHGADIYDDYAHHPDELRVLLDSARNLGYQRVIIAFQPHTYSRTIKLFDRFTEELKRADITILAEIYAAREENVFGVSSADLCKAIPGAAYCSTLEETAERLKELARPGDLIITVGAGDIYKVGEALVNAEEK